MASSNDEFLTVHEVAAILKVNQQTVRNWIDHGDLPAIRVGRRVRITRSDFEGVLERSRIGPGRHSTPAAAQAFWEGDTPPTPPEPPEDE